MTYCMSLRKVELEVSCSSSSASKSSSAPSSSSFQSGSSSIPSGSSYISSCSSSISSSSSSIFSGSSSILSGSSSIPSCSATDHSYRSFNVILKYAIHLFISLVIFFIIYVKFGIISYLFYSVNLFANQQVSAHRIKTTCKKKNFAGINYCSVFSRIFFAQIPKRKYQKKIF